MGFVFYLLLILVVILIYYFIKPSKLPPGPLSLPLIGSIGIIRQLGYGRPQDVLQRYAQYFGSVLSFRIGTQLVVVLDGYDAVYQALVTRAATFSDRPTHLPVVQELLQGGRGIIFNSYSDSWRTLRRFTLQSLRDFGVKNGSIEDKIAVEIEELYLNLKATEGNPVDLNLYIQNYIGNVIHGIVFGIRYDFDDPNFFSTRKLVNDAFNNDGPVSITNFLPGFIAYIINRLDAKNKAKNILNAEKLRHFVYNLIEEHENSYDENNIRDFVDLYIKMTRDCQANEKDIFTKSNMYRVIVDLFLAGSETTCTVLTWVFLYMIKYPHIQQRCQHEIEKAVGTRVVHYSDRDNLVYIEATLFEVQRLCTVVPLSVAHCTSTDATFRGHSIPRNTMILPNLHSVNMDPKYWNKPSDFNPDRFINASGQLVKHEAFLSFSIGPRCCPGESLARLELFLVFSNMLQRFTFTPPDSAWNHSMDSIPNHSTNAPLPYTLRARYKL